MEADLQRFYNVDYRDRWRRNDRGQRVLSLRRLDVLVRHLPHDSAVFALARDGQPHWSVEAHLLDDLRMAIVGSEKNPPKPHPARPKSGPRTPTPERKRKVSAAKARAAERRRAIEAGEIT